MAIYYIDPHTTTNGTGTWASPWSLASSTRTGLTNGDEIRIKGVALTSLLTATSYTATVTNNYQLTITAGGGLGADWVAGDVAYLPAYDTFFKVYSVSSNVIQVYTSSSMLPIKDWSATSLTVRKVDTTTYPVSTTSSAYNIGAATNLDGVTVSDCWTNATTRVTDGTVKTLFNNSYTVTNMTLYMTKAASTAGGSGWTVNLQNTHVLCSRTTTNGYVETYINSTSSTYSINQIYSWGSGGTGFIQVAGVTGNTINIEHFTNYYGLGAGCFATQNNTYNITNLLTANAYIAGNGAGISVPNNTINITNFSFIAVAFSSLFVLINNTSSTLNITGTIDQYGATAATYMFSGYGNLTINIGASVVYYYNKRAAQKSLWTYYCEYSSSAASGPTIYFPAFNVSNGWTYSVNIYNTTTVSPTLPSRGGPPDDFKIIYPVNNLAATTPAGVIGNCNIIVSFEDGSAPFEILGVFGTYNSSTTASNQNLPKVTTDAAVYRTTGPSLKSYLDSRVTSTWASNQAKATKTIKIPCTSGTSYTVTGYIRTDDTAYTNGDCRVGIYLNDAEVTGQDMTTACENAWEQFTLTFTATTTGEYVFTWSMYYANGAKSYWLDDLTIA